MDKACGYQLYFKGVVVVRCELMVLPCRMFDGVDRVGYRGVGAVVESFVGIVDMGGCCCGFYEECEVEPQVSPMGSLHFLGMVSFPQYV